MSNSGNSYLFFFCLPGIWELFRFSSSKFNDSGPLSLLSPLSSSDDIFLPRIRHWIQSRSGVETNCGVGLSGFQGVQLFMITMSKSPSWACHVLNIWNCVGDSCRLGKCTNFCRAYAVPTIVKTHFWKKWTRHTLNKDPDPALYRLNAPRKHSKSSSSKAEQASTSLVLLG